MPKKRLTTGELIHKLREAEVLSAQGRAVDDTVCQSGVTEQTYFRSHKEYDGLKTD